MSDSNKSNESERIDDRENFDIPYEDLTGYMTMDEFIKSCNEDNK